MNRSAELRFPSGIYSKYAMRTISGQLIFMDVITDSASEIQLDLGKLPVGIYLLSLCSEEDSRTIKVIKE